MDTRHGIAFTGAKTAWIRLEDGVKSVARGISLVYGEINMHKERSAIEP